MRADAEVYASGSYEDQPEHYVRTVLNVPLSLPRPAVVVRPSRRRHAAPKAARHKSIGDDVWSTTWIGMLSAVIVLAATSVLLIATGWFLG